MSSLKTIPGIPLTTLGVASKFMQTCQSMPRPSYNLFNNKNNTPSTF